MVTAVVLGVFLATGTLQHTNQGWGFRAGGIAASDTTFSTANFDPKINSLLHERGTGTQQTTSFTTAGRWSLNWVYDCPGNSGSIQVVARSDQGASYPAGVLSATSKGAGQSNVLPAGTYSLQIATGTQCTWSVGARPNQ